MISRLRLLAACLLAALAAFPATAEIEVRKVWDGAKHCAFTDMVHWNNAYWIAFRESDAHVHGSDGKTRIIRSQDGETWKMVALLAKEGVDLRDPKLSITPSGALMILQGGSIYADRKLVNRHPFVGIIPPNQLEPGPLTPIVIDKKIRSDNDWLWRVTWRKDAGYGVIYQAESEPWGHHLVRTTNGIDYELVKTFDLPGKPNESTVRFAPGGEMWIVARNEGDDTMGRIGRSRPPFAEWTWNKLPVRLGGPDLLRLKNGAWLLATRKYAKGGARTMIGTVTGDGTFEEKLVLPSGGDTSYPRMMEVEDQLWMSHYSSHEGSTAIYLAKIPLAELR